ncbi:MAG: hypothetical protein ACI8WT_002123 [Clostridium sp.]|jgi:hypothetical protein
MTIKTTTDIHKVLLSQVDAFPERFNFVISANFNSSSGLKRDLSLSITYTSTDNAVLCIALAMASGRVHFIEINFHMRMLSWIIAKIIIIGI